MYPGPPGGYAHENCTFLLPVFVDGTDGVLDEKEDRTNEQQMDDITG